MKTKQDRTARLNLVGSDPVRVERIKHYFRRIPSVDIDFSDNPLFERNFDLFVIPAKTLFLLPEKLATLTAGMPIVAYGNPTDLTGAFELGCRDYLKEPWLAAELHCRVQLIIRESSDLCWDGFRLTETYLAGPTAQVKVNYQEYRILRTLLENIGHAVPREVLFYAIWGNPGSPEKRAVDVHISSIRRKLENLCPGSDCLVSVRGVGYRLD